ncbi:hypothetical protein BDW02DRAFT_593259 [Decorospora gaudefroyi]|uniref:CCHC-type domain-containing protein n=1 Tax=Decorospora gaudefroyi TaxID=184978 RepID=A0A6A5K1M8_9PLEO|nr:hypothetical protein BDW02DRAFT_593259 [Decorospora gaudefroyi]
MQKEYDLNRDNQVIATISSNDELLALANSQPEFVRSMLAELMNVLRQASPYLDAAIGSSAKEALIAKQRHYEKEVTILQNTLSVTELERDDSKREINRLSHLSAFKTGCSDPDHAELYEDWKHEESQATKFYNLYLEFFEKHKAERAKTDCYYEQQAERDADNADLVAQNKALKQRLVLAGEATDKLQGQLTRQHQEYNDVVSRLQRYDHNFRPFTIQRREGRVRDREDIETTRPRRPLSPERRETRLTSSPNPYPSRQITPLQPLPRTNHFSRNGRRHSRRSDPLNQNPQRFIPPPYDGRQTTHEASTGDETKNYDKWRSSAIQKCESLPQDKQLAYLEMRLDPYYARSTYEKVSDAQSKLSDGSLKTAPNEKFADWRGRFMSVCRLVKLSDQAMIGYARTFLRPSLAVAASHAFEDEQDNALVKFLDAARRADMTQKQINQGKSIGTEKSRSTTTKPRQRSPNDRNAERKAQEAMAKAKVCFRCGESGHQARDKTGCPILDWDKIKPKLHGMGLRPNAMEADFTGPSQDDDHQSTDGETTEEELDDMGEPMQDF